VSQRSWRTCAPLLLLLVAACGSAESRAAAPKPNPARDLTALSPLPSARQLAWQELDYYAFVHFNMNTFSGREWGEGQESPDLFAPSELDCRQWASIAREAGMRGIILTAKHHDGFCLWPSKYTAHSVASSSWRAGQGDVLRELSDACREFGLQFGVYLSPWDRHSPLYGDSPMYNDYYAAQLEELLSNYGEVFEVWWDGACGEGPNGKRQVYDFERFTQIVRRLQPKAVIFSDIGPDVRWVGNESGFAGETCWSMLNTAGFARGIGAPPTTSLNAGDREGLQWVPAECDVSIRPGWYYHAEQDGDVKTLDQLVDIYERSVGHNGSLLLNLPVDRRGLVHEHDAARLMELRAWLDATYGEDPARESRASADDVRGSQQRFAAANVIDGDARSYWAANDLAREPALTLRLEKPRFVDRIVLREPIALGQRVARFRLEALVAGSWRALEGGTTIGNRRIVRTPLLELEAVRVTIEAARAAPAIASFELGCTPPTLELRAQQRNFLDATEVEMLAGSAGTQVHYTLDGSEPTRFSAQYSTALRIEHTMMLRARAFRGEAQSLEIAHLALRKFERGEMHPAMHFLRAPSPGMRAACFDADVLTSGDWSARPAQELAGVQDLDAALAGCAADRALLVEAVFEAAQDGVYEFSVAAEFSFGLEIDGEALVDSRARRSEGGVALERGWHALRLWCGPRAENAQLAGRMSAASGTVELRALALFR
jgi:alpha-L-fucosidase